MNEKKMKIRFFTIADYEEEEIWLREQHQKGWKLENMIIPCFYFFEKCEPEDVVYRLDYKNCKGTSDYMQMFSDYGWEYFCQCTGWLYFRKPVSQMDSEQDGEIFSDSESKLEMIRHIMKTRMFPLIVIFLCCLLPQFTNVMGERGEVVLKTIFSLLFLLYLYLFVHCGYKLWRLQRKFTQTR